MTVKLEQQRSGSRQSQNGRNHNEMSHLSNGSAASSRAGASIEGFFQTEKHLYSIDAKNLENLKYLSKRAATKKRKPKKDPLFDNIYMKEAVFALIQSQNPQMPKKSKRHMLKQAVASTHSKASARFNPRTKSSLAHGGDTGRCLEVLINSENRQPNLLSSVTGTALLLNKAQKKVENDTEETL
jgi:hypothetical protein